MERRYLTIKEASKMLGVTPLTLRNWDKKGKLIAYRHPINNYRVYRLDQVELFLRAMESGTGNIVLQSKKLKIDFLED
ncbi:MAG: hypothetical protein A3C84_04080 [Candidatus Ryanbacteria bacterium RIFCSPHIGHO2_02_FULL_48_12]|uniref:HTH merR-type domain-containing protein n=1 Tax=Candidatus Ryanbacteria bacterium RIFCSPHIGHO2_01_FULL_48_27 TaxID=1802115 RepID=A0A1G2G5L0_9BACT|nr:MAG: hypothetical protein A2756_00875 [Candidatus Ryanbacteria bacterium RIFCSPHIGHO2_01_FULL_48_27]OGZ48547.1 MAG: hypothetical protein A3C84_04080 [Candidatus Ryanbacteria bacterium RIFCSPHIGHO2_02_FULL_48_12]